MKIHEERPLILPTGPTAPSTVSPRHADAMEVHHIVDVSQSLKQLVRETQFDRLIRGEIEPKKPEVLDMDWLLNHKHSFKLQRTTKSLIWFRCSECRYQHLMSKRRYRRMFNAA